MSENPEAQPSTGVLGRIGSWFSPWRGKSSTENAFPTSDQAVKLQQDQESKEPVRAQAKEQQRDGEEEKEQSSITKPLGLYRNIFPSEEENATQSAHRDGSVVCSTEPTEGGPTREEFVESRKNKIGQGREECNNATSVSGNPEKNVSHVTDVCSSSEQGVVWDTARTQLQAYTKAQAQTGKRLHVYLEETSVIQCGEDPFAGQEVVYTRVPKSLQVICRAKSSPSLDSPESPSSVSTRNKSTNVRSTDGTECHHSGLVGVSLEPQQASRFEPEPDIEQTEISSMGRKNTARRKFKKHSQGEGGSSPREKQPPIAETAAEGSPTSDNSVTSPQGKSPKTHMEESVINSSSKDNPTSQASPELGESKTSCPVEDKPLDNFQDSVPAATVACVVDKTTDMEDEDDLYKVERKTETPESKRRSMKVSRSEVKLFTKNVPLNPKQRPEDDFQEFKSSLKNTKDEAKDKPETEISARRRGLKKINEEPKPVVGRIADKISLFEHPAGGVNEHTFQAPQSANVSPARKATDRLKANLMSSQRSRSGERYYTARSSSASPAREGPKPIKELVKNFTEASKTPDAAPCPFKSVMTGMPQKSTSSVADPAPKSGGLDHQAKLDPKEQIKTNKMPVLTLKPNGLDTTVSEATVSIPKEQLSDLTLKDTVTLKTADQDKKLNSVEASVSVEGPSDSLELSDLQSKGASRTGSRSKRRKSREPTSPLKPNSENKDDCPVGKPVVPAVDQKQGDDTVTASAPKQLTEEVSLPGKGQGKTSYDTKQKTSTKEPDVQDKQEKLLHSSFIKDNTDKPDSRQEMEPSVNKDEPDTASYSSGTKMSFDKDNVILPQKEEMTGGQSLLFMHERDKDSKEDRGAPVSSPSAVVIKKIEKQDPPAKHPGLDDKLLVQSKQKSKGTIGEPSKNKTVQTQETQDKVTELTNLTESADMEKFEKSDITSDTAKTEIETPPQLHHSSKNINVSGTGQNILGGQGGVVLDDDRKNAKMTQAVTEKRKPETRPPETASAPSEKAPSILPDQTEHVKGMTTHPQKAVAICAIAQTNDKDVTGTKSEKNVSTELPCKSPESPGTATEPVIVTVEPHCESGLVEQMDNTKDDSCTHGANDAELSTTKSFTKATAAVGDMTLKSTSDTPALITVHTDRMSERDSSVKEPSLISVSKSVSSEGAGKDNGKNTSTVKSVPSEVKLPGEIMTLTTGHPQCDASENRESTLKGGEKKEKTAFHLPVSELVDHVDVFPQPQISTVKKETVSEKLSQTLKVPTSQKANKHSSMKKLNFPRGLSKDDSATEQDAPSSWLDVDLPKRKLKVPVAKLSSSGSESNLLDTSGELDDDDFVDKIKKLCVPFSLPPRKHNPLGPHQPPFAMPSIREDRFEKTFDPEEFTFGLRAKNKYTIDTIPSTLAKLQNLETKSSLKPARASLADRSILLNSLDIHSRLKTAIKDDENVSEEKDEQVKVKSRLEGSCVFSRLTSSILRGKGNGIETQAEGANTGKVSPSEAPQLSPPPLSQPPPPSPTDITPLKDTLAKQNPALSNGEKSQTVEVVVSDSGPPLPSFNDIKLPDYLEKYLPREPAKPVTNKQGQEQVKTQVFGKMPTQPHGVKAELALKPGVVLPDAVPPSFPVNSPYMHPSLTEQPQPQGVRSKNERTAKGFHKRPGKMVLFEKAQFSGQVYEIYRDVADATSLQLSPLISVKVVRGCWLLYEKPDFQGRSIALEEGGIELTNVWAELGLETEAQPPMLIGSIRLVVWDYSIPHIDLFTEPEGLGRVTPYHDDTVETGSYGIPLSTASIQVHSGVWLVFSDPGFQGMLAVLQAGVYPFPETWGFPSPFVGSLRPLKMGGFKVENASEVKAVVYEKPGFEGTFLEIDSDVFSFCESEGGISADGTILGSNKPKSVGSLKIMGGLWVGYSEPGFEGQQHILEEGEYFDSSDWGGSELISLRPILSDFFSPHLKMFCDRDFSERGVNIDLTVPVMNMEDTGYGMKTQSIDVIGGIWVVFEEPGFCGEPYVLERGLYGCPEDWGALRPRVASAMPVVLDDFENTAKFKVQLFSEKGFQGSVLALEDSVPFLQEGFSVASCKVLAGSWLAFEGQDFTGRMYVLEEGSYSDLRAMGCVPPNTSILSLQTVGFEFSLPSITLFERCGLRGKRVILTDGTVNLQLAGGCSRVQSVLVEGGMWVLYEGINYRGAQILLKPGEVPDWHELSSWLKIGSLRPLTLKQAHFRLRNRQTGLMMSVTGDLDDVQLMRVQETEETDGFEQIWFYQNGHLHCKLLEECCLSPTGNMMMAGSRVGLNPEPGNHLWSITPAGFIRYTPTSNLVLEVKGGLHFDKNQVILNTHDPNKLQQQWNVEII